VNEEALAHWGAVAPKTKNKKRRIMDVYMNNRRARFMFKAILALTFATKINVLFQTHRLLEGKVHFLLTNNPTHDG